MIKKKKKKNWIDGVEKDLIEIGIENEETV